MISRLSLRNFKCFPALGLQLRPLTVLTGVNGSGKSTVLQGLLLARQAAAADARVVQLNGPHGLALGEAHDVLYPDADPPAIEIGLDEDGHSWRYAFSVPDDRSLHLPITDRPGPGTGPAALGATGTAFTYLNAERLGPRDQLGVTAAETEQVGVGSRGEYTAQALALHETDEVRPALRHPPADGENAAATRTQVTTLRTQVENWASSIIRPIRITARWLPGVTASLIRFQEPVLAGSASTRLLASDEIRPANMGFGFSYALPILVAGLLIPEDGLLIVENPEAHLHPAGQSRLGRFLARVAGSGAQVILETHSDHVLNGIRLAITEDQVIPARSAIVHYFGDADSGGTDSGGTAGNEPTAVELTERGGLSLWPRGFFDQIEEDLGRIARARRREA